MKIILFMILCSLFISCQKEISQLNEELQTAAQKGDWEIIKSCLEDGAEIDYKNRYGETALRIAVRYHKVEAVKLLLEKGADVNILTHNGSCDTTILDNGYPNKNIEELLIRNGAKTSFQLACYKGDLKAVKQIYECDGDLYSIGAKGTSLHCAAFAGHIDIVKFLVGKGADVNVKNFSGETVLEVAKTQEIKDYLIDHSTKTQTSSENEK